MTIFLINSKDSVFGTFLMYFPNFGGKKFFSGTTGSLTHNFKWISITMPKLKIMIKFEENAQTGRKDRRTDRPYFIGPFPLPPGVPQVNESQKYHQMKKYLNNLFLCRKKFLRNLALMKNVFTINKITPQMSRIKRKNANGK